MPDKTPWAWEETSMWIANDEGLYREALRLKRAYSLMKAARLFIENCGPTTPDGKVKYSQKGVMYALKDLE